MSFDYENRIVAYVDILGFKNLVDDSQKNGEDFERIYNALKRIHKIEERIILKGLVMERSLELKCLLFQIVQLYRKRLITRCL